MSFEDKKFDGLYDALLRSGVGSLPSGEGNDPLSLASILVQPRSPDRRSVASFLEMITRASSPHASSLPPSTLSGILSSPGSTDALPTSIASLLGNRDFAIQVPLAARIPAKASPRSSLRQDLDEEVSEIFRESWEVRDGINVPEEDSLGLGNDAIKFNATVLYADLADSTALVDGHRPSFAAELYKAFLHCAAK